MIPGLGRSPGEGKGYPLQYSGMKNSMNCIVHGVTKGQTQLSNFHSLDGSRVWRRIDTCIHLYICIDVDIDIYISLDRGAWQAD